MPLPLAIPIIQGGLAAAQTLGGIFQRNKARREFEAAEMPDYTESAAYQNAEQTANLAGRYAQEGMPEQARRFQEDMIGRSGAAALASQGTMRGLAGAGGVATSLADSYRKLAADDANMQIQQRGNYLQQRNIFQREQARAFDDQMGNFINQQAARLGRMSAGNETMNSGLGGLSSALSMGIDTGLLTGNPGASGGAKSLGGNQGGANPYGFPLQQNPLSMSFMNPAFATVTAPKNPWE